MKLPFRALMELLALTGLLYCAFAMIQGGLAVFWREPFNVWQVIA